MPDITIRNMSLEEAAWAIDLAAGEGWNPGLSDAACFYRADPAGFYIALKEGSPIGCISAVSYPEKYGFLGLYIVLPEYRRQGYGHRLWQVAMDHLKNHNVGLDGVLQQVPVYAGLGFRLAYHSRRFEGQGLSSTPGIDSHNIINISAVPFDLISRYDRRCFPSDRSEFLQNWLKIPHSTALACMDGGRLTGYGVIRPCRQGYKIGPLLADDFGVAEKLFLNLVSSLTPGSVFYLDVIEPNQAAMELARRHRLKEVFVTGRMYTGPDPSVDLAKIFGVTSFELG